MYMLAIFIVIFIILISTFIIGKYKRKELEKFSNNRKNNDKYKFYLINLDQNKERLELIDKQSKREKLDIIRFPAIFGKRLDESRLVREGTITPGHTLHKGELGCALSHILLLKKIYKTLRNDQYGVIFEDDVIIPKDFITKLYKIVKNAPMGWEILYLGGCNIKGTIKPPYFIKPTYNHSGTNLCAHAYVVKRDSIPKILNYLTPLYRPIDSQLRNYFKYMNVYFVNPNLVIQNKDIRSIRRDIDGLPQSKFWRKHQTDITIL